MSAPSPLIVRMAEQNGLEPIKYWDTLCATIMPGGVTKEQVTAFLTVASTYNLNPFTKEIYAYPAKGGVHAVVSIDGWMKLGNSHPQFDGLEHEDVLDESGALVAIKAKVYRKDRRHPVAATEYMAECSRSEEKTSKGNWASIPWRKWPRRMLRHKATIQALRYAFGFAGIIDPDEAERFVEVDAEVIEDRPRLSPTSGTRALKDTLKINSATGEGDEDTASSSSAPKPVADTSTAGDPGVSLSSPKAGAPAEQLEPDPIPNYAEWSMENLLPAVARLSSEAKANPTEFAEFELACDKQDREALARLAKTFHTRKLEVGS